MIAAASPIDRRHGPRLLAALLALAAAVTGCARDEGADRAGTSRESRTTADAPLSTIDLRGVRVRVGSKDYTEQLVLGHIAHEALRAAGARPEAQIGGAGTDAAREALLSGEVDLYWEYTGTAWVEFLGSEQPIRDRRALYDAVASEDARRNDVVWLEPARFDNTYAIAVAADRAQQLGVETLSDYARLVDANPDLATLCVESEFATRRDGLPGLERHYDFDLPDSRVARRDTGVVYTAVAAGDPCTFGEVFRTDPRITTLELVLLDDDRHFFPIYQPAVTIRRTVLDRTPEIADVFERVAPLLDERTMTRLNREVDVKGRLPRTVARRWLREVGLTG